MTTTAEAHLSPVVVKDGLYFKGNGFGLRGQFSLPANFEIAGKLRICGVSSSKASANVEHDGYQRGQGFSTSDGEADEGPAITGRPRFIRHLPELVNMPALVLPPPEQPRSSAKQKERARIKHGERV